MCVVRKIYETSKGMKNIVFYLFSFEKKVWKTSWKRKMELDIFLLAKVIKNNVDRRSYIVIIVIGFFFWLFFSKLDVSFRPSLHFLVYRMCHKFRFTKQYDYFRVDFDHLWIERHFFEAAGVEVEIGLSLNITELPKLSLSTSVICTISGI